MLYRIKGVRKIVILVENLIFNFIYKRKLNNKVKIYGFPIITFQNSNFSFGKNITLISESYFSEPGVNHPVMIRLLKPEASLKIGNNVGISGGGICVETNVEIGNDVMMGANSFISDTDFHPIEPKNRRFSRENVKAKPVIIEDNVFIGMNSVILKGVTIGKNSIIAANSTVVKDIPSNEIWGGAPAKFLRKI
ncbi:acyltransferase [Chondrinema litorale]|uniref:acyltransferase n=1 Tax=Chondrinema litorale TaxID=2994555 RepID=UPI002543C80D|nr:acyltransferase [Chondrinema litorale]UZR93203.1 acyltransferase [Chondrinema litorale]